MLLDQPNTFLDLRHQVELSRLLKRLATERGIAILMASHDLNLASTYAGRLVLLEAGGCGREWPAGGRAEPGTAAACATASRCGGSSRPVEPGSFAESLTPL